MVEILGAYEEVDMTGEELVMGFSPSSIPIRQRWRNNGLSADFLADYLSTFFPTDDPEAEQRREDIKGGVSYIANELLENAMKFNDNSRHCRVSIRLQLHPDRIVFHTSNGVTLANAKKFHRFVEELMQGDPQEIYLSRLEENAINEHSSASGLGLLTMVNDYSAQLGWKFESYSNDPEYVLVTTMVRLAM
jgi:hypothetical protein